SAKFTLISPGYYKSQFEKLDIYQKISNDLAPNLVQSLFATSEQGQPTQIDTKELTDLVKKVITPDKLKSATEAFLNSLNDYLKGTTNTLSGKIDLREIKKSSGDILEITMKAQINGLRDCTPDESAKAIQNKSEMPTCLPNGVTKEQLLSGINISDQSKEEFSKNIPDEFDLAVYFDANKNPQNARLLQVAKTYVGYFNLSLTILSIVCAILLILIGLLIWKPASSVLKWLGIAIIIPAAIMFLGTIGLYLSIKAMAIGLAGGINLPAQAVAVLKQAAEAISSGANFNLMIVSSIFVIVAIALLIIGSQLKKKQPDKEINEKKK
ncbi:MAG: hypothetical protein M1338_04465, partial [Patescibacteria group bacterium]|nr:hypothetical protein [Patescibacteria group bacterium]